MIAFPEWIHLWSTCIRLRCCIFFFSKCISVKCLKSDVDSSFCIVNCISWFVRSTACCFILCNIRLNCSFTPVICIVFCRLFCWQSLIVNLKICHLSMQVFSDLFQRKKNRRIKCCYCTACQSVCIWLLWKEGLQLSIYIKFRSLECSYEHDLYCRIIGRYCIVEISCKVIYIGW